MICMLYIPCKSREEAIFLGTKLLEEKLIACANIVNSIDSIYIWEGKLEQAQESILLLKSIPELKHQLEIRIEELHSYSCPCIITWQPESVNEAYEQWVRQSLSS